VQFLSFFLGLGIVREQIELEASGASYSMQNIAQSTIKELMMIIPPVEEANDLVAKININIKVFNTVLSKTLDQVGLLQERRTALISAAVTGKIDVRNWVSPDASSTANTSNTSDSTATTNSDAVA